MRRIIHIVTILCCVTLFASCNKGAEAGALLHDGAVRIVFSMGDIQTRATTENGSDPESRIANLKLLFYEQNTQKLKLFKNIDIASPDADADVQWQDNALIIKRGVDQTMAYDIYVIANWTEGFDATDFAVDSPLETLSTAFTQINGQIVAPDDTHHLLMAGSTPGHVFRNQTTATVALVRQVAKLRISVKIDTKFKAAYPKSIFGTAAIGNAELTIYNVPNSSYVSGITTEQTYNKLMEQPSTTLLDYPKIKMADPIAPLTVYVYENITMSTAEQAKDKSTFMILRLPYQLSGESVVTENYYKFYIQDNADSKNPHKTLRNHVYDLTATVVGFGELLPEDGRIHVTTNVLDWNAVDLTTDIDGVYLSVDETPKTLTFTHPSTIKLITNHPEKVTFSSINNKVDLALNGSELSVNVKDGYAMSEPITNIDWVTITLGRQTMSVPINYKPSMAQQFASGMLVTDRAGGIRIGTPREDPRNTLLFKYGVLIGMLSDGVSGSPLTIAYNPFGWGGNTSFNPFHTASTKNYGADFDYLEQFMTDPTKPGLSPYLHVGDVCRYMGKDSEGRFWRIPKQSEWRALLAEGQFAVGLNGQGLVGSNEPNADFGWFLGPKAKIEIPNDTYNPIKGSIFLYNIYYGGGKAFDLFSTMRGGTLNIMSSSVMSIPTDYFAALFCYVTANGQGISAGDSAAQTSFGHAFGVRCIRDYTRK